ncbi:hypothetical protein DFJ74DRAFT_387300 [Hyaloraphidium curvatum]|nr:hypothetical protein DFJ74DRAFT_387300 [Hyaloraphidium curvatum]
MASADAVAPVPGPQHVPSSACVSCWKDRKKCLFPPGAMACERCQKLQRACERRQARRTRAGSAPVLPSSGLESDSPESDSDLPHVLLLKTDNRTRLPKEVRDRALRDSGGLAASANLGLATFWEDLHPTIPIVHKTTFEAALGSPSCPIYRQPPQALAFAMAACGILYCHTLPNDDRIVRSASLSDAAYTLVSSSYDPATPASGITDLEAAQVFVLLVHALAPRGDACDTGALLRKAVAAAERMLPQPLHGTLRFAHLSLPTGAAEWVQAEMMLRTYILVASLDVSLALQAHRCPHATYFGDSYIPLPHHDSLFDHPDRQLAHSCLTLPPAAVRPASFLLDPRPEACPALVLQFVGPALSRRASHLALRMLATFVGVLCARTTGFARAQGLDPLHVAALPDDKRHADERTLAAHIALLTALGRSIPASFPRLYAFALERGDASPFLADAQLHFSHPAHAAGFLASVACAATGCMHAVLVGCRPESHTDPHLWTAPEFTAILADAALFMRMLRSTGGNGFGCDAVPHVVRAGALALAGRKLLVRAGSAEGDPGHFVADIRTAEEFLKMWGSRYGGLARLVADDFHAAASELLHTVPPSSFPPAFPRSPYTMLPNPAASVSPRLGLSASSIVSVQEEAQYPMGLRTALVQWDDAKQAQSFLDVQAAADRLLAAWAC